jgi:hypothetical protein
METKFLDGLSTEIVLAEIWPRVMAIRNDRDHLVQTLCGLRGVCTTWRNWVDSQPEWEGVRRFGDFLLDEIDEGAYACDSDGLPYEMYPDGYWDEY